MKKQPLNITNGAKPDVMMRAKLNMYIKDKYTSGGNQTMNNLY
jgi:hypothetical protein